MATPHHLLTTRQLAHALGVSESSVKRWVDGGEIEAHITSGGHRRISIEAAIRFIRRQRMQPVAPHLLALQTTPILGDPDTQAADLLFEALFADHASQARAIISGRFLAGADIATIGDMLIRPAMHRMGELWKNNPEGILLEHRAVETCIHVLAEIATWLPIPTADSPVAISAAGPGDLYLLPPMLAFLVLRESGMRALNLGPMTPYSTAAIAIRRYGARLCSLSQSIALESGSATGLQGLIDAANDAGCLVVVGGRRSDSIPARVRDQVYVAGSMAELSAYAWGMAKGAAARANEMPRRGRVS